MTSSNTNKILVFFILTLLVNILIEEIQHFYHLFEHLKFTQLVPGIIGMFMMIYYEEHGSFKLFFKHRVVPTMRPSLVQIILSLIPLVIIPLSFYIYKSFINHEAFISKIELSYLMWPFIGVFFEELGWRGYFQNRAGSFIHMLLATLLTGTMWFFVQYDLYLNDPFYGAISLVLYLSYSIILAYLFFQSNRNILLGYVFRLSYSILGILFITQSIKDINFMFVITPLYMIVAALVLIFNKHLFGIDPNDDL